jgi:hypothetical protein
MSSKNLCQTRFPPALRHKVLFPYEWPLTSGMGARQAVACSHTRPPRRIRPTRETPAGSARPPRIVSEQCACRISAAAVLDLLRPWRGCRRDYSLRSKDHTTVSRGSNAATHLTMQDQPQRHAALSSPPCASVASRHRNEVPPVTLCVRPTFS